MRGPAWTDQEKVALLVSIIHSSGSAPKWPQVCLPEGRTIKACSEKYKEMVKDSVDVKLADKDDPLSTPSKRSPTKGSGRGAGKGAGKDGTNGKASNGNKRALAEDDEEGDVKEELGEGKNKRVKTEESVTGEEENAL